MKHCTDFITFTMHPGTFFLIVFINTLSVCMSTVYSNAKPSTEILETYSDQEVIQFDHLAVDKYGRWVYIGAPDYLYQLSSNLQLKVKFTLPELIPPDCTTQSCLNNWKQDRSRDPTRNKILLLDYQNQQLISCGSFYTDRCHAHNVNDISKFLVEHSKNVVRGEYDASHVAFIAPNFLHNSSTQSSALYVGDCMTGNIDDGSLPTIAIKDLAHENFLSNLKENGTMLQFMLRKNSWYLRVICGFNLGNISYFLTTGIYAHADYATFFHYENYGGQLIKIDHLNEQKNYLHDDAYLTCNSSQTRSTWLKKRIKHAYIYELTNGLDSELGTDLHEVKEKIMFLLFDMFLLSPTTATEYSDGFVVCKYEMNEIAQLRHPMLATMNGDLVFIHEGNINVTAMAVTIVENHTVMFFGTDKGHLQKVSVKGFNSPDVDTVNYYPETIIDEGSPVNSDMLFDSTKNFLYVMTKKKLTKVKYIIVTNITLHIYVWMQEILTADGVSPKIDVA